MRHEGIMRSKNGFFKVLSVEINRANKKMNNDKNIRTLNVLSHV